MSLKPHFLAAGALLIALVSSCTGLQRTLSTLEVGYANGTGSTSGAFGGSLQQGGWYGQPGDLDGTYAGDSDFEAWSVSIRPLAALEPPREVLIVNAPPPPAPALSTPLPSEAPAWRCMERSWHCAGCQRVVTVSGGSEPHVCQPPAQPPAVKVEARTPHGWTLRVEGEPAVELDPLEPFQEAPQVTAAPPPPPEPKAKEEEPLVPRELWGALGTVAAALVAWLGRRQWLKHKASKVEAPEETPE